MARRINPLYAVNAATPLGVATWTQRVAELLNANFTDIETTLALVVAAQAAATAAQVSADAAAADAATASASAQAAADQTALANSYVSGATITGTDAGADVTISISAHTRYYPQSDGTTTSVAVNAGSITGQAYSTFYYIYYDDAARAGGAVTYLATTSDVTAAQTGDRHTVGSVTTPAAAAAPSGGSPIRPPGPGQVP
jgi:hypothetical protein